MKTKSFISFVILLALLTNLPIFTQWQQTALTTGSISSIAGNESRIFVSINGNLYFTSNTGTNWNNLTGLSGYTESVCTSGSFVFATNNGAPYISRSTDNGANWHNSGIINADGWFSIAVSGNNVFASRYVIQRSTDGGENWSVLSGVGGSWLECMAANGTLVFALSSHSYLYRSTNNGDTWKITSFPQIPVNAVAINGSIVYTATENNGVYVSTDNGTMWNQSSLSNQYVSSVAVTGNSVFASTSLSGIYVSTNNGTSWQQINQGLPNLSTGPLLINGIYIYSGITGNGVWKRPLSEILALQTISGEIPVQYGLSQNYPNPFNPTTKIRFDIPPLEGGMGRLVTLKIYDALGREVAAVVSGQLQPGTYEVDFNASKLTSGVYYYRLSAGNFSETKKMVLLR